MPNHSNLLWLPPEEGKTTTDTRFKRLAGYFNGTFADLKDNQGYNIPTPLLLHYQFSASVGKLKIFLTMGHGDSPGLNLERFQSLQFSRTNHDNSEEKSQYSSSLIYQPWESYLCHLRLFRSNDDEGAGQVIVLRSIAIKGSSRWSQLRCRTLPNTEFDPSWYPSQ